MDTQHRNDSESTLHDSPRPASHWHLLKPHGVVTSEVLNASYEGSGTHHNPYLINFIHKDPGDPKQLPSWKKWSIVATVAFTTFVAALGSSIYLGAITEIQDHFSISEELAILGLSFYVLGFVVGPLFWAPLGELYGRQVTFLASFAGFTIFNGGAIASQNIQTLLILRFFAGTFASCPFTNSNGNLADIFEPTERGLAFGFYSAAPFMGPILGPAIGGFLASAAGWRWVLALLTLLSAVSFLMGALLLPETYGPVILRRRAKHMSRITGDYYVSKSEMKSGPTSAKTAFAKALSRPWAILFVDPIVLCLSLWISLVYGTLYLFLAGYPYVYQSARGWSPGLGGLALLGIGLGVIAASIVNVPVSRHFGAKLRNGNSNSTPPEIRLQSAMLGALFIPCGIFWFAWTNAPSVPWPSSVIAGSFFGFGMVLVWTSVSNYLVDAYKVYAASALAGQVVMRSIFGAVFPLFTGYMFRGIGLHWAASVPGFIALACAPLPFVFYQYGATIRARSKWAGKAEADTRALRGEEGGGGVDEEEEEDGGEEGRKEGGKEARKGEV